MPKFTKSAFMIGLFIANVSLLSAADKEAIERVYKETNGTWKLVSSTTDGESKPAEELQDARMELKDGKWTFRVGDELVSVGTFAIESFENGYRVVSTKVIKGLNVGESGKHISKNDSDKLMICRAPAGEDVPKEFASKKGSGYVLHIWERVTK